MKVYLDVCCLNRLFDDQSQARVAVEAAAVEKLLEMIDLGRLVDYSSEMATIEIERTADADRRQKLIAMLPPGERIMPLSDLLLDAAGILLARGFELADAVHLAAARSLDVDVFLTVDDKLLRRAGRTRLGFRVQSPVRLIQELGDVSDG